MAARLERVRVGVRGMRWNKLNAALHQPPTTLGQLRVRFLAKRPDAAHASTLSILPSDVRFTVVGSASGGL